MCNDVGKRVDAVAEYLTARETAALITRVTGKEVQLLEVTQERFYSDEYHNPGNDEMWLKYVLTYHTTLHARFLIAYTFAYETLA